MPEEGYIRGARAGAVDARRVGWVIAVAAVLGLAAATIALTLSVASDRSATDRLRREGVSVRVTVTGCEGISSGVGMGVVYYDCRGSYLLDGVAVQGALIHGSGIDRPPGQVVEARAVPGDPGSLSLANSGGHFPSWTAPVVLGAVTLGGAALVAGAAGRSKGRRPAP